LVDVVPGHERAVAAALGRSASALVAPDARAAFALVERARAAGLGSLVVLVGRDPSELVRGLPVVSKAALLSCPVPALTREGCGRGPTWDRRGRASSRTSSAGSARRKSRRGAKRARPASG